MAIFNTISPEWLHPQERDGQQARQYARIVGITHNKQEIQRSATNTNIRVLQGNEDCGLVFLIVSALPSSCANLAIVSKPRYRMLVHEPK
jgi:hypothetical protein